MSNTQAPCPCIFRAAPADPSLKVKAAQDEYAQFCEEFRILPQTFQEYDALLSKPAPNSNLNRGLATPGLRRRNMPTWFIPNEAGKVNTRQQIFTHMFDGLGVVEIAMPGPETPVCTGMHFPSLLNAEVLTGLKAAGIDVVVILVPGIIDTANAWARRQLASENLAHLMPNSLPVKDLYARPELHPTMPLIFIQADPGLEKLNELGLVREIPGLGLAAERAFMLYNKQGYLETMVKAEDPSAEKCGAVLGAAILETAQKYAASKPMLRASL